MRTHKLAAGSTAVVHSGEQKGEDKASLFPPCVSMRFHDGSMRNHLLSLEEPCRVGIREAVCWGCGESCNESWTLN